jgi:hypothetical protein
MMHVNRALKICNFSHGNFEVRYPHCVLNHNVENESEKQS